MFFSKLFQLFSKKSRKEQVKKGCFHSGNSKDFVPSQVYEQLQSQMWAVGGGKGGVGKSLTTLMLGASLTRWGKKVILVDADLGGSNLNLLTGINYPPCTLADFMQRRVENIEDIALDTPIKNLRVICGADDILGIANPKSAQKIRLLNHLNKLEADIILLDLGAGTSYTTLDFFLFAPNRIILLSPQSTSMQNAYGFVKTCLIRKLTREFRKDADCLNLITRCIEAEEGKRIDTIARLREEFAALGEEKSDRLSASINELNMGLVVNMVKEPKDINLGRSLIKVTKDYLTLDPEYLGFIQYDKRVDKSINNMAEFLQDGMDVITEMGFYDLSSKIVKKIYRESKGLKAQSESSYASSRQGSALERNAEKVAGVPNIA